MPNRDNSLLSEWIVKVVVITVFSVTAIAKQILYSALQLGPGPDRRPPNAGILPRNGVEFPN